MTSARPRPTLGARLIRFVVYGGLSGLVIARSAAGIRDSAKALTAPCAYLPAIPCIPCALGMSALLLGYLVWLVGASVSGWSMPLWTHIVPAVCLTATLALGPFLPQPVPKEVDMTRPPELTIHAAMVDLGKAFDEGRATCTDPSAVQRLLDDPLRFPLPGFRSHGLLCRYRVRIQNSLTESLDGPAPGDRPPTLLIACSPGTYRITAVTLESMDGKPGPLRDGLGHITFVSGTFGRGAP